MSGIILDLSCMDLQTLKTAIVPKYVKRSI